MAETETEVVPKKRGNRYRKGSIPKELKAEMVAVLPEFGNCQSSVARAFGVSANVVNRAINQPDIAKLAKIKKQDLADGFGRLVAKLTAKYETITEDADLDNKGSTLLGIAADKFLLYSGEATAITETRNDNELREKALALLERLLPAYENDRARALAALCEAAPTLGGYVSE